MLSAERSGSSDVTSREVHCTGGSQSDEGKVKWVTVCDLEAARNISTKDSVNLVLFKCLELIISAAKELATCNRHWATVLTLVSAVVCCLDVGANTNACCKLSTGSKSNND